tara:strand:+ start:1322 stop:1708 length:387 start_codon:yes stop_codon:yes gene_type:complete
MDEVDIEAIRAEVDAKRREQWAAEREEWIATLDPKDWLFDGSPIRGEVMLERWNNLDWSEAYMDMGPSIAGNLGPYWHVPLPTEETVHRLYPKILQGQWLLTIRQAVAEAYGKMSENRTTDQEQPDDE